MANTVDQVNVLFGADVKNLTTGLSTASREIEATVAKMTSGFSGLGGVVETAMTNPIIALGAAFTGLSLAIGTSIAKTNEMTREAFNFSSIIGINTQEASALSQALGEIGLSTDTYSQAFLKFVRQVKNSGSDLEKNFGLKLRDANGHLRDGNTLFQEALSKVFEYKAGIDQDTVAMALFGKSVADVIKLHRLTAEATEEAKKKNEELGLTITEKNIVAYNAWQKALQDVHDVFDAVTKVIGDAFLPILTELAQWFSNVGPYAVALTRVAIAGLANAFYLIQDAAVAIVSPIQAALDSIKSAAINTAKAIANVASFDFSAAKENIKAIGSETVAAFQKSDQAISEQLTKHKNAIKEIINPTKTPYTPTGGSKSAPNLERSGGGKGKNEALQLQEEILNHQKTMDLEALEQKRLMAQSELNLGRITKQQLIQQEMSFEDERYNIERAALEKRQQLLANDPNSSPATKQKALDQILELEQKHETAVLKLKLQAAEEAQKYNIQAAQAIEDSFQNLFQSVISGQKSLKEAFDDFVNSIISALSKLAAQYLAQALFGGGGGLGGIVGGIFGGGGGIGGGAAGGGLVGIIGSIFGGFRASGGDVQAGMAYVVGEKGAEMFVPKVAGTIVPNGAAGGGKAVSIVNYFSIQGSMSQQSQQQIAAMVGLSVNRAVRRNN